MDCLYRLMALTGYKKYVSHLIYDTIEPGTRHLNVLDYTL